MRVLLLKTSSLGDVIHTLPALTDAADQVPDIRFDWVIEEAFADIPRWHPAVENVIPMALRRWRRGWVSAWRSGEIPRFLKHLRKDPYDLVLDAQGLLLKSAMFGIFAKGTRAGYDRDSIRDPWATVTYHRRYAVSRRLHAIERNRRLFGLALGYQIDLERLDYGISLPRSPRTGSLYLVFLHATTWESKHWPESYWGQLARMAVTAGYRVIWPWGTSEERQRAERMIAQSGGELAPKLDLNGVVELLSGAAGVIGVDSGLAHMAAALNRPAITIYGPTSTGLTGALGVAQRNMSADHACSPCFARKCKIKKPQREMKEVIFPPCFHTIQPEAVWHAIIKQMEE